MRYTGFRSHAVTLPTRDIHEAMAEAELGNEVIVGERTSGSS